MKLQSEEPVVAEERTASPLTVVVILAVLVGVLLTLIAAGVFLHYRQGAAFAAEVLALRGELRKKGLALEEMQAQNATLAKHVKILKGYSIASSSAVSEKATSAGSAAAAPEVTDNEGDAPAKKIASPQSALAPKMKKATAGTHDCDLVGKSADQQVATLQRCVSLIDSRHAQAAPMARHGG